MESVRRRDCDDPPVLTLKKSCFFKLIREDDIHGRYTELPLDFFKNRVPKSLLLEVPTGTVWELQTSKIGDNIRLENGWPDFALRYSIGYGHSLLFQQEEINRCLVSIFDQTNTEIFYSRGSEESTEQVESEPEENFVAHAKTRKHSSMQPRMPCKKMRNDYNVKSRDGKVQISRRRPLKSKEKATALMAANHFKSFNPHFKVVIQPSYLHNNLLMTASFANKYIKDQLSKATLGIDGKETTWSVEVRRYDHQSTTIAKISRGWSEFVNHNKLNFGDVCVFELTNISSFKFKVSIFRANQGKLEKPVTTNDVGGLALEKAKKFRSNYPSFKKTMQPSYMVGNLSIPKAFVIKRINPNNYFRMAFKVADKSWSVNVCTNPNNLSSKVQGGWAAFRNDNNIMLRDICIFELIKKGDPVLTVSILRDST